MFPGTTVLLKESAHIGHGAIIHGATIGKNVLVGMNSVIMDDAIIGDECIVGALSFDKKGSYSARSIIAGNPAKVVKEVSDKMIEWKTKGTQLYQTLPKDCHEQLKPVEPLTELPADRPSQETLYETWNKVKKS